MATTRLIALHAGLNSIESALRRSTEYIENSGKTDGGELVLSYECDPLIAPQEFALSKREYALKTGRDQGKRDIIAYHLRQSFKPDEIDAESRLLGELIFEPKPLRETGAKAPQLLIDIQEKIAKGYGKGFEKWATIENLKRSAKTLIYIQESGINSYDELEQKCSDASGKVRILSDKIRAIEPKQKSINDMQKHIGTYGKTRAIYSEYMSIKNARKQNEFYENHRAEITLHQAANTNPLLKTLLKYLHFQPTYAALI